MRRFIVRTLMCAALLVPSAALAQFTTGSTGADGALTPSSGNTVIDLSLAGTGPGTGTYDAARWAIVFNYTTVNIPAGYLVTFINHPSNAPVIWLTTGSVTIAGTVDVSGKQGDAYYNDPSFAAPGPGGFQGGRKAISSPASPGCNGFGPGGAPYSATAPGGGGYATAGQAGNPNPGGGTYGDDRILPLIGGSGAGGNGAGGGAGGGAILIASPTSITLSGNIYANGGANGYGEVASAVGSGGAIRLRAPSITGNGLLRAYSGAGAADPNGLGRIRVEATTLSLADVGIPPTVASQTPNPIFPASNAPTLVATTIAGVPIPLDPIAGVQTIDTNIANAGAVTLQIQATNIAPGTTVTVTAQPDGGPTQTIISPGLVGTLSLSTTSVSILIDRIRRTEISLRANTP